MIARVVDVIAADLAAVPPGMDGLLATDERARAQRLPAEPRRRWIAARAILRTLLAGRLEVHPARLRLEAGAHAKPRLHGGEPRFNLSHSGDLALFAIADGVEVGVDVELASRRARRPHDELALARRLMDAETQSRLAALSGKERSMAFLQAWVAHEARVKCAGVGLGAARDRPGGPELHGIWVTPLQVGDGAFAALAVEGGPAAISLRRYESETS